MTRAVADQVVVITGGSSGIGRCTAELLAARGAKVVITARGVEPLEEVARVIRDRGGEVLAIPGDVTSKSDLAAVAAAAVERFGRIDTWVNNAGLYIQGHIQDITLEEFRRVIDVNLIGLINGTQCALEVMLPRKAGTIVQVSSVAGPRGVPYTTPYSAAKSAIDGFTQGLRAELWGSGVQFCIVYPPTVDTPIFQKARGKLGVLPKPAPPIAHPVQVARAIAEVAESGKRHRYVGWSGPLIALNIVAPPIADWLLHRVRGFTYSDLRAGEDNLDGPLPDAPHTVLGGWSEPGWKGLTLGEVARVLPLGAAAGAAATGFLAARLWRWLRGG
jgi:NAD(P)-dependent dehydrogenase (short-subunit alcohol dehydrogenase family)